MEAAVRPTEDRDPPTPVRGVMAGIVAAMAMTGMRQATTGFGLIEQTPPDAVIKKATGPLGRIPTKYRRGVIELAHWSFGAVAGAAYTALPEHLREKRPLGAIYGLAILAAYDFGQAPIMGLKHAKRPKATEQLALMADHVLYGSMLAGVGAPALMGRAPDSRPRPRTCRPGSAALDCAEIASAPGANLGDVLPKSCDATSGQDGGAGACGDRGRSPWRGNATAAVAGGYHGG